MILLDLTSSYDGLFGLDMIALLAFFRVFGMTPVANDRFMISCKDDLMRT